MPEELQEPSDDDSIIEIPQELKEPQVIMIDDDDEGATATLVKPQGAPVDGRGDCNYSHPFSAWHKLENCRPGDTMPEHIYINPDEREKDKTDNPTRGIWLIMALLSYSCMSQYQKDLPETG